MLILHSIFYCIIHTIQYVYPDADKLLSQNVIEINRPHVYESVIEKKRGLAFRTEGHQQQAPTTPGGED